MVSYAFYKKNKTNTPQYPEGLTRIILQLKSPIHSLHTSGLNQVIVLSKKKKKY